MIVTECRYARMSVDVSRSVLPTWVNYGQKDSKSAMRAFSTAGEDLWEVGVLYGSCSHFAAGM
jgi:hypothetical protein